MACRGADMIQARRPVSISTWRCHVLSRSGIVLAFPVGAWDLRHDRKLVPDRPLFFRLVRVMDITLQTDSMQDVSRALCGCVL